MLTPQQVQEARQKLGIGNQGITPAGTSGSALLAKLQGEKDPNYLQRLESQFKEGAQKVTKAVESGANVINDPNKNVLQKAGGLVKTGLNTAGAVAGTAFAPISAAVEPALKPLVEKIATIPGAKEKIQQISEWAKTHPDAATSLQSVFDIATLGVGGAGEKLAKDVAVKAGEGIAKTAGKVSEGIGNVAKDVIPSTDRMVNYQVTRALDLTQGDVKNIAKSTGNEVGEFMAKNNLIGKNKEITGKMVNDFYKQNYDTVREEIGKVTKSYTPDQVPRFVESLKEIKKQISDVPGMQEANAEVDNILKQKVITLNDVQKVKELMDEHFSLYKVTGDVKESVAKEGLVNIRNDIKQFIENEVKSTTGADIAALNNNVATSKSIVNAVEDRSTRGLTRSNLKMGDLATFGGFSAALSPIGGVAAVAIKKAIESPSIRLRLAKWLDGISDARKLKVIQDLEKGEIPKDISEVIQPQSSKTTIKQTNNSTMSKTLTDSSNSVNGKPNSQSGSINLGTLTSGSLLPLGTLSLAEKLDSIKKEISTTNKESASPHVEALKRAVFLNEAAKKDPYGFKQPSGKKEYGDALGAYQITEARLKEKSKSFLGKVVSPKEFLASKELQEKFMDEEIKFLIGEKGYSIREFFAAHRGGFSDLRKKKDILNQRKNYADAATTNYLNYLNENG